MFSTPSSLLVRLRDPADAAGWDRFVALYTPLLFAWARRMQVPPADAADLIQDLFTCLVEQLPSFTYDPRRSFRAWMKTLLVNRWRTWLRHRAAGKVAPGGGARLEGVGATDPVPEFEAEEYRRHLVGRALELMRAEFQPTTWKACWEYVVSGRSAAEVAAELGLSEGAVYVAKCRVLRRLREELRELLD